MTEKENIKINITMQSFPLAPVLIICKDYQKDSGVNIITISYISVLSEKPAIIGLAIRPQRHSYKLIRENKEFTVNLPTPDMLEIVDFCGTNSGRKIDKVKILNLTLAKSKKIKTPVLKQSPLKLECQLIDIIRYSQYSASHDFFVGKVMEIHRKKSFVLKSAQLVVTTNFDYRLVDKTLGRAHKINLKL
jgi:flavin reductase (DIM6/NTAB) family NADH-FMN oxidoreductase RutF